MRIGFLLLCLGSGAATAGDIATERTQLATAAIIEFIYETNQQIEEFTNEIRDFEETAGIFLEPEEIAEIAGMGNLLDLFADIETIVQEGEALAHSAENVETWFEERYDTYDEFYGALTARGYIDQEPVLERLRTWSTTHRSTIMNTLRAHGVQTAEVDTAQERLALLQEKSRTAAGRMEALQIGQELATEEIRQLHGLKELLMEQSNLHASYFAFKASMESEQEAHEEFLLEDVAPTILGNEVGARLP